MNFTMKRARVDRVVSQFPKVKILVFGDVGVDKYTIGKVTRISPEAPIPIVEVTHIQQKLGLASNVADNIAALGGQVALVGVVGKDQGAEEFKQLLHKSKIQTNGIVTDSSRRTTLKERVVAEAQQVVRIDHETKEKIDARILNAVWKQLEGSLKDCDCVIVEDYAKGLVHPTIFKKIVNAARAREIPILVDPNVNASVDTYLDCSIITPNITEAEALSQIEIIDDASLEHAGRRILDRVRARIVVITRGKDGMAIFVRDETKPILIPTFAREVFDVSGAGDTVIATLALALAAGADLIEAALLANFAAGIEVGKRGTATVTVDEIRQYIVGLTPRGRTK